MANANLEKLQQAYRRWSKSNGSDTQCWLDILANYVVFHSMGDGNPVLAFARTRHSKQEMADYFTKLATDWTMVYWSPETFVHENDKVAIFGVCSWRKKATGKIAECRVAHLAKFHEGRIIEFTEIFDSARALAAAKP